MSIAPTITDPTYQPSERYGLLDRFFLKLINDPRDLPFLHFVVQANLIVMPIAVYLFLPGRFSWWLAAVYLALVLLEFMGRFVLILHNTSHRTLFRRPYRRLNHYLPWCLGPFFGETPDTYYAHHVGMHHPENNLADDLSSTMRFQRDSALDFARYFARFFFGGVFEVTAYHWRRGHYKLVRRELAGEIGFFCVVGLLLWWNWRPALVVFVVPWLVCRFAMMAGNWAQHAFIDAADPANPYRNSLTVVNCRYNRRCFNDGYHIGHHIRATRHWTDMPIDFAAQRESYVRNDAIVLEGIDFFGVWACLMLKRYDWLARRFVHLGEPRSEEEIIALLKRRTRRIEESGPVTAA